VLNPDESGVTSLPRDFSNVFCPFYPSSTDKSRSIPPKLSEPKKTHELIHIFQISVLFLIHGLSSTFPSSCSPHASTRVQLITIHECIDPTVPKNSVHLRRLVLVPCRPPLFIRDSW